MTEVRALSARPRHMARALVLYSTGRTGLSLTLGQQRTEALRQSGLQRVWDLHERILGPEGLSVDEAIRLLNNGRYQWVFTVDREGLSREPLNYLALVSLFQRERICLYLLASNETLLVTPYTAWQETCRMAGVYGYGVSAALAGQVRQQVSGGNVPEID